MEGESINTWCYIDSKPTGIAHGSTWFITDFEVEVLIVAKGVNLFGV
jgi:hypothetical protein